MNPWPSCGDMNADGIINIADLTYVIAYLYGGRALPIPTLCIGDLNNDGVVNIADLTYVIAYLYGGRPPPIQDCCE